MGERERTKGGLGRGASRRELRRGGTGPGQVDQPGSETPDLASLYVSLAPKLERSMRREVGASEGLIEEACQFAWAQLVRHLAGVNPDAALAWLVRTAVREACRMTRNGIREPSLEAVLESAGDTALPPAPVGPE